jgi:hypothetical protein
MYCQQGKFDENSAPSKIMFSILVLDLTHVSKTRQNLWRIQHQEHAQKQMFSTFALKLTHIENKQGTFNENSALRTCIKTNVQHFEARTSTRVENKEMLMRIQSKGHA